MVYYSAGDMNDTHSIKYIFLLVLSTVLFGSCQKEEGRLKWDTSINGDQRSLVMPDDVVVKYTAYEKVHYVSRVVDSAYQYLNIYVPHNLREENPPILFKTYTAGYMASKAKAPSATDATGYALAEGYVVCVAGCRGWNSTVDDFYNGRAPEAILDLKAAVRYLHANDSIMPGDANRIIASGTSAGGAMVALLGSSANHSDYALPLSLMGAADAKDDVWAVVSYCPITNLENSDMAYEWLFSITNDVRGLTDRQSYLSGQLASMFPLYLESQGVSEENMEKWMRNSILNAAFKATREGQVIPPEIGVVVADSTVNLHKFIHYIAGAQPLKTPPAFDAQNVVSKRGTFENKLFGTSDGKDANFTEFSMLNQLDGSKTLSEEVRWRVRLMNPMNYIGKNQSLCRHWYIRYGTLDRDTSFPTVLLLKHKLNVLGVDVNFAFQWGEAHNGDYKLNELFDWLSKISNK
ncbi:MAG: carboxylesterase family protein [Bacteroidales bacterium]|nr:carboxylesterase family protein [Bacteroidales bacterium]